MKKTVFIILLLLITILVNAQERKKYKGVFMYNGYSGSGEYEYVETGQTH